MAPEGIPGMIGGTLQPIPSGGIISAMAETMTYRVPGMHCGHCKAAVEREVGGVPGVEQVEVDLDAKLVTVRGRSLEDGALRAAIDEAGYEAE
jgi:copper chaperone CopZ